MTNNTSIAPADVVRSAFNFNAVKYPLSANLGDDKLSTPFYGVFRDDTYDVISTSSVSAGYEPHQSEDVIALVEAAQSVFDADIEVRCHFNNGHFVSLGPTDEKRRSVVGTADNVWPRMIIRAGYDGRAFRATLGYYRDACRNLAMLRTVKSTSVVIRHSSGLRDKMNELIQDFQKLNGSWTNIVEAIEYMKNRQTRIGDFLAALYPAPAENTSDSKQTRHRNMVADILKRLYSEHEATAETRTELTPESEVSNWLLYNAVQGYVQHDKSRRNSPTQFARILLASEDPKVAEAERLALSL